MAREAEVEDPNQVRQFSEGNVAAWKLSHSTTEEFNSPPDDSRTIPVHCDARCFVIRRLGSHVCQRASLASAPELGTDLLRGDHPPTNRNPSIGIYLTRRPIAVPQ
eukprot:1182460-Prorocentrum_minimum.AAC.2